MNEILITGGCSFSVAKHDCWSSHLETTIKPKISIHTAASCQGNDLISKKIIYQLIKTLQFHKAEDILIAIMWSGPNRKAIYLDNPDPKLPKLNGCPDNPTAVVKDENKWYILNSLDKQNEGSLTNLYNKNFYSKVESYVSTCENILRVQWFLQKHNIKYFMSTYTNQVLPRELLEFKEVEYLYNAIDFTKFLPVEGEYEWCKQFYGHKFIKGDNHPTSEQHKSFTEEIIIPFLRKKKYV